MAIGSGGPLVAAVSSNSIRQHTARPISRVIRANVTLADGHDRFRPAAIGPFEPPAVPRSTGEV